MTVTTPPERIYQVPATDRVLTVSANDRVYVVPDDE